MRLCKQEIVFFRDCEDLTSVETLKEACSEFFGVKKDNLNAMSSQQWESLYDLLNRHLERRESISIRPYFGSHATNSHRFYGVKVGVLGPLNKGPEGRVLNPEDMIDLLEEQALETHRAQEKSNKIGREMRLEGLI